MLQARVHHIITDSEKEERIPPEVAEQTKLPARPTYPVLPVAELVEARLLGRGDALPLLLVRVVLLPGIKKRRKRAGLVSAHESSVTRALDQSSQDRTARKGPGPLPHTPLCQPQLLPLRLCGAPGEVAEEELPHLLPRVRLQTLHGTHSP